jgi:hypothetical protein
LYAFVDVVRTVDLLLSVYEFAALRLLKVSVGESTLKVSDASDVVADADGPY